MIGTSVLNINGSVIISITVDGNYDAPAFVDDPQDINMNLGSKLSYKLPNIEDPDPDQFTIQMIGGPIFAQMT